MVKYFFGFISFFCMFFLSGYITKLGYKKFNESDCKVTNAVEKIFGYCIYGIIILGSIIFLRSKNIGLIFANILTLYAFSKKFNKANLVYLKIDLGFLIKSIFIFCIILVFFPMITFQSKIYQLPVIFDLPKSLAALVAVSHSNTWPLLNPFFPEGDFAYNVFYFLPIGSIIGYLQNSKLNLALYGFLVIWTAWNTLGVVELILNKYKLSEKEIACGLLLGTFFSSLIPLVVNSNYPIGYLVGSVTKYWIEDFFTIYIYIPQYVFGCACILASYYVFYQNQHQQKLLNVIILCSAACLTSFFYVFFIYAWVASILLISFYQEDDLSIINFRHIVLKFLFVFLLLTAPFLLQAKLWSGSTKISTFANFNIYQSLIWIFPYILMAFFGLIKLKNIGNYGRIYILMMVLCFLNLIFVLDTDFGLKLLVLLKFILILPATLGIISIYQVVQKHIQMKILLSIYFLYFCLLSVFLISSYVIGSYRHLSPDLAKILSEVKHIDFNKKILMLNSDQELAAMLARPVYMNFRLYREDAYLPFDQRSKIAQFFEQYGFIDTSTHFSYLIWKDMGSYHLFESLKNFKRVNILENLKRDIAQINKKFKSSDETFELNLRDLNDVKIIEPLELQNGLYLLRFNITGEVKNGDVYVSIHEVNKTVNIQKGVYSSQDFVQYFYVEKNQDQQNLTFSFVGSEKGQGYLIFNKIELIQLSRG